MNNLQLAAEWSDKFFNFIDSDACLLPNEGSTTPLWDMDELDRQSRDFVSINPNSPFAPTWYVKDFLRRV